jgi:cytochrome c oxidase subunit 2
MVVLMRRLFTPIIRTTTCAGALVLALCPIASSAQERGARIIDVTAERFAFTPSEIRGKAGEALTIRLRSDDTDHGFRILDTDVNVRIPKRGKGAVTVTFKPDRDGRFTFECSHVCGAGHAFMRGVIIISK